MRNESLKVLNVGTH
ncbi:unnamed protein product [Callosobruchus maculatus]|uniref:Uncharacterized protein n=1 Tax=Callosobruchus maculatus TaxID=64391 RepID=A0A653CHB0_CALMS|nr:unnamed protein product [Callosobruchus maculatus]